MDNLEKYFEKNRESFSDEEPMEGHFARFSDKLNAEFGIVEKKSNRQFFMRIAAGFLILMSFSFFLYDFAKNKYGKDNPGMAVSGELQEAMNYYDGTSASRLDTIKALACCGKEKEQIYSMATGELRSLDANAAELKRALQSNPDDERIKSALVKNQQMKEQIMDDMIIQMNKIKK